MASCRNVSFRPKWDERFSVVLSLREDGLSYAAIGRQIGCNGAKAKIIEARALRYDDWSKNHDPSTIEALPARAFHALRNDNPWMRAREITARFVCGKYATDEILNLYGIGMEGVKAISDWLILNDLELRASQKLGRKKRMCPHCGGEI